MTVTSQKDEEQVLEGTVTVSGNSLSYTAVITEGDWKVTSSCSGCVTVVNNLRVEEDDELIYMGQTLPLQEEQEKGVLEDVYKRQLMGQGKKDEAEEVKKQVAAQADRLAELSEKEKELDEKILKIMMVIPNIIDPSVPSGKDDSCRLYTSNLHQVFIEPEGLYTKEMYVGGMSSSLPEDVQHAMYSSVAGLEHVKIVRNAYAIEYDCIDARQLYASLEFKKIHGLFSGGQFNGSSGYEAAAAQGLICLLYTSRCV